MEKLPSDNPEKSLLLMTDGPGDDLERSQQPAENRAGAASAPRSQHFYSETPAASIYPGEIPHDPISDTDHAPRTPERSNPFFFSTPLKVNYFFHCGFKRKAYPHCHAKPSRHCLGCHHLPLLFKMPQSRLYPAKRITNSDPREHRGAPF